MAKRNLKILRCEYRKIFKVLGNFSALFMERIEAGFF